MLERTNAVLRILAGVILCCVGAWGQSASPNWKDAEEEALGRSLATKTDPQEMLAVLNEWKDKYPDSEFKNERTTMLLVGYAALDMAAEAETTAREMLAGDQLLGSIQLCRTVLELTKPSPKMVDLAADAGGHLIAQATLVLDAKLAGMTEEAWTFAKAQMQAIGYKTLGWVNGQRNDYKAAETAYTKALELNPGDADLSVRLAVAINQQQKLDRQAEVVYHLVRAASYEGLGALSEEARSELSERLSQLASPEQLDSIRATAKMNPHPPPNFSIEAQEPDAQVSATTSPPQERYQPPSRPTSVQTTIEDFETYYRRRAPARALLSDALQGFGASLLGQQQTSLRERLYRQWLAETEFKLRQQGR